VEEIDHGGRHVLFAVQAFCENGDVIGADGKA
jgi:hypothetical protein